MEALAAPVAVQLVGTLEALEAQAVMAQQVALAS